MNYLMIFLGNTAFISDLESQEPSTSALRSSKYKIRSRLKKLE